VNFILAVGRGLQRPRQLVACASATATGRGDGLRGARPPRAGRVLGAKARRRAGELAAALTAAGRDGDGGGRPAVPPAAWLATWAADAAGEAAVALADALPGGDRAVRGLVGATARRVASAAGVGPDAAAAAAEPFVVAAAAPWRARRPRAARGGWEGGAPTCVLRAAGPAWGRQTPT